LSNQVDPWTDLSGEVSCPYCLESNDCDFDYDDCHEHLVACSACKKTFVARGFVEIEFKTRKLTAQEEKENAD
jgi:hypothetical protein